MRILVPLDGSELAEYAVGQAARVARGSSPPAEIVLMRVISLLSITMSTPGIALAGAIDAATEAAGDYLRALTLRPSLHGLKVSTHAELTTTSVAQAIGLQAKSQHADLIMLTSHGRTGIARALLGSVVAQVVRTSEIPTIVFQMREMAEHSVDGGPYTILVPLDETLFAEHILPPAVALARALDGEIVLFEVLPSPSEDPIYDRELLERCERYLNQQCDQLIEQNVRARISVAMGDPATKIAQRARREDDPCDLIALATHARKMPERFFIGSVADDVLTHSHLPLMIVHPPEATSTTQPAQQHQAPETKTP